jgi:DNA-directed RNA polymerase subunit H (RpoH/RPB5)
MASIYENIYKFATEYRKYTLVDKKPTDVEFKKQLQYDRYIKIEALTPQKERVTMVILDENSKYTKTMSDLRLLLVQITRADKKPAPNSTDRPNRLLIIVSKEDLKAQIAKIAPIIPWAQIFNYYYHHFIIEIPKAIFCSPHVIIGEEERQTLRANYIDQDPNCNVLPRIFEDDPQCIWIGAKVGDIVRITRLSNNVGESVEYRKVVRRNGAHITSTPAN